MNASPTPLARVLASAELLPGARIVRALRLLTNFGIVLPETIEFNDAEIDPDTQLILDLRTARVSPKAHSQCRRKL